MSFLLWLVEDGNCLDHELGTYCSDDDFTFFFDKTVRAHTLLRAVTQFASCAIPRSVSPCFEGFDEIPPTSEEEEKGFP